MKTINKELTKEVKKSYLSYATNVITNRAIPDARDGLKPVHRRILFLMYENNKLTKKYYRKSARIVGEVMGKYHPHGDNSIYLAIIRMTQKFLMNLPLIKGQGNFGSIDGDEAAKMRYTEIKLSKTSYIILKDLKYNSVKFIKNYDNTEMEPEVLPSKIPNLIINGSNGIAVGMTTNIPPHNINEIINGCTKIIDNNKIKNYKILKCVKGPDFPTGGKILNGRNIKNYLLKGKGLIILRSKINFEKKDKNKLIIVKEIPFQMSKLNIIKTINILIKKRKIEDIYDIRDESNKLGVRLVIEIRSKINKKFILNQLYNKTQLQSNMYINMIALNKKRPQIMSLKDILFAFINFRKNIIAKRTNFLLEKAKKRMHIMIGIIIGIRYVNKIIKYIKVNNRIEKIVKELNNLNFKVGYKKIKKNINYRFSKMQIKSILRMKLYNLNNLQENRMLIEIKNINNMIKSYIEIAVSKQKIIYIIKKELNEIQKKNQIGRKTEIINENINYEKNQNLIKKQIMFIIITKVGFVKSIPLKNIKDNDKINIMVNKEDIIVKTIIVDTYDNILFFSISGLIFRLKAYKIPIYQLELNGEYIVNLLGIKKKDRIMNIIGISYKMNKNSDNIILITENGKIIIGNITKFYKISKYNKNNIVICNENIISIELYKEIRTIFFITNIGKIIKLCNLGLKFFNNSIFLKKYKLILKNSEKIISIIKIENKHDISNNNNEELQNYINNNSNSNNDCNNNASNKKNIDEKFIISIDENGYGKKIELNKYKNNKYIDNINNNKNHIVVFIIIVKKNDSMAIVTNRGVIMIILIDNIPITNIKEKRKKIVRIKKNDKAISIIKIKNI